MRVSRRTAIAGMAGSAFTAAPALASLPPDLLVLHNGRIWTGDPARPAAEAVAIRHGRVVAIGSDSDILNGAGASSERIDLGGKRVTPGFNDAHCHLSGSGVDHLRYVACDSDSIPAIQQRLRERAARLPAGQPVIGFLYDDGKTPHPITRAELDHVSADRPVLVQHRGGHTMFVNSAAFAAAGISETTPDPKGGKFGRDGTGRLNGLVVDLAFEPFAKMFPGDAAPDEMRRGIADLSKQFAANGITSICDAGTTPEQIRGYLDARREGTLATRVYANIWHSQIDKYLPTNIRSGFGDDMVRIGAVKLMADGSISERSALLSKPYEGRGDYCGVQVQTPDELYTIASKAHAAGWQLGVHGNGDVGIAQVLDLFERLQKEMPRRDARFRIEHCTLLTPDLIRRIKAVGALPILFGGYVYFHGGIMDFYGAERLKSMFALRDLIDAGVPAASSSDYTASPFQPMMWLRSQIDRRDYKGRDWGLNQRVTAEEALRAGTWNGAFATFEETQKGRLAPGMLADLVVWSDDFLASAPERLMEAKPERTMLGGRWTYQS
jgi:hypothetical protein